MWETWVLTVFSATPSSSAMTLFERPAGDQDQDVALARGEVVDLGGRAAAVGDLLDDAGGDRRVRAARCRRAAARIALHELGAARRP